eukprot:TRINITY_DN17432_c0_g1_i1.p1 TRINITY_DN17432_c0_g1~~TRINITY_DN17432_c0_g1_i1.p1  ORF type:complete len:776 (-),score=144.53 TRINITY_DN17432_c0_g1_i1:259-2586(-)
MVLGYVCPCCGIKDDWLEEFTKKGDDDLVCKPCHNEDGGYSGGLSIGKKAELDLSVYTIPLDTSVVCLKGREAFDLLSDTEKAYAYYVGKASWEGAKICLLQCSPESVPLFSLFQLVFSHQPVEETIRKAKEGGGLTEDEIKEALMYIAAFYGNFGNYKSFGDTKFVPSLQPSKLKAFLKCSGLGDGEKAELFEQYWQAACVRMYSLLPRQRQLGLGAEKGVTTYFSANCEESDAEIATKFLDSKNVSPYNTRLFKESEGKYVVKVASSDIKTVEDQEFDAGDKGKATFKFEYGDYAALMARICENLEKASTSAANDTQKNMLAGYVKSFKEGSIDAHKDGSRYWIKDVGPAVESYIGFIESYRDPAGMRGEWEGFVACVNKEVSRKFQVLVDGAPDMLKLMPWSTEFEKKEFQRPDFTSLEVLAFGSSGVPAGINIPNYDDIRQDEGFKNVSLGNVLQASYGAGEKPVTFLVEQDQAMFKSLKGPAFEVQVGVHELLGHGSGRLYHKNSAETKEFLEKQVKNPIDGTVLTGPFYAEGATWDSTFGKLASSYEECRAECCGIYLSLEAEVLKVFGHEWDKSAPGQADVHDVTYINWLLMVRAGLTGLEFYTPETGAWRQAHMNARYVILRVLLEAGQGLVKLETTTGDDGEPNVLIHLERSLIPTVGKKAIGEFLQKLQIYKSLGDFEQGSKMFAAYSEVPSDMAQLRAIVMARKEPRKLLVQPHMEMGSDGKVAFCEYDETPEGMIKSFVARYPSQDDALWALYQKEAAAMEGQ